MTLVLDNQHYFGPNGFPIAVCLENTSDTPPVWPSYTKIEHSHNFWEIVLINAGNGMHCLEGDSFPVSSGDVFLLQGSQKHYFHNLNELELVNVLYDPDLLSLPEKELRKLPGYSALFLLEPQHRKHHRFSSRLHLKRLELGKALHIVSKINKATSDKEPGWEVTALTSLQELIIYLSKSYISSNSPDAASLLRVADVITLLENDYMNPWNLNDLVKTANMSKSNLIRVFRNATGQTPLDYLIDIRIQHATDLLSKTNLPVNEIAYSVGFSNSNYFSRIFRDKLKTTPSKFRLFFKK